MKYVIIIAIAFVLLFVPINAFAESGYFVEDFGKTLKHEPNICILQPSDPNISDKKWKQYFDKMRLAVHVWNGELRNISSGHWKSTVIDVPLNKVDLLNKELCDITVEFTKGFHDTVPSALGWAAYWNGEIKLKYHQFTNCGKEYNSEYGIYLNKYCFSELLERPKYVAVVLKHEIGHTFGLGHYRGYDTPTTQDWYDSGIGLPSIMTYMPNNEDINYVTKIDTDKILEIYGSKGFGKKPGTLTPIFNERIIPEAPIPVAGTTNIHITGNSVTKMISGNVPDKLYKRGVILEILIEKPNGIVETKGVSVSKMLKSYKYQMTFGQNSQTGNYMISLKFDGKVFEKIPIYVSKGPSSGIFSDSGSKSGKYLENISIQANGDKYTVTSNLSKEYTSTYLRITAENECPVKKQIFQKDYSLYSGTKVSFSFYQLSSGKPNNCSIHFSITDFNGRLLDSIKLDYDSQTKKQFVITDQKINNNPIFTEDQKQKMSKKIDSSSVSMIKLKNKMDTMWNLLSAEDDKYTNSQSKQHVEKAWQVYNTLYDKTSSIEKSLNGIVQNYILMENDEKTDNWNYFYTYSSRLSNIDTEMATTGSNVKYIHQELEYAKKAQNPEPQKQCFMFWC